MGWYNEVKNMEENITSFLLNNEVDYDLLRKLLRELKTAEKNKQRSFEMSVKVDSSNKQRTRHETNCKDYEYKTRLVQRCINELNNDF